jgi:ribosome-binding protein aMBF1 (putative translation factor)
MTIQDALKERDWSPEDLALRIDVSANTVRRWLEGNINLHKGNRKAVLRVLGKDVDLPKRNTERPRG